MPETSGACGSGAGCGGAVPHPLKHAMPAASATRRNCPQIRTSMRLLCRGGLDRAGQFVRCIGKVDAGDLQPIEPHERDAFFPRRQPGGQ